MTWGNWVLVGSVATLLVALLGVWQLILAWLERSDLERRSELERVELEASRFRYRLNARLARTSLGRTLEEQRARAGIELLPLELLSVYTAAVVGGLLFMNLLGPAYFAALGAWLGFFAVRRWLDIKRRGRLEEFVAQLPELARTLSNGTQAGRSLTASLQLAAHELGDPAASELKRVSEQLRIGSSADEALEELKVRLPSRELAVLVSTLVIQQRTGGDVVTALRDMAETLETRKDLRREVRTIVSGAVQTAYVTGAMGVGLILLMNVIYSGMIDAMARQPLGQIALVIGAAMYAMAFLLVRRMTDIDV